MKYEDIEKKMKSSTSNQFRGDLLSTGKGCKQKNNYTTNKNCGPLRSRNTPESWLD